MQISLQCNETLILTKLTMYGNFLNVKESWTLLNVKLNYKLCVIASILVEQFEVL